MAVGVQPCCWKVEEAPKPELGENRPCRDEVIESAIVKSQNDTGGEIRREGRAPRIDHLDAALYAGCLDHLKMSAKSGGIDASKVAVVVVGDPVVDKED
jgi:hypothetical protein